MKKVSLSILIMICILTSFSFANKFKEVDAVELKDSKTEQTEKYHPVNLMLKGEDVIGDVPPILYTIEGKTRTLVPVRFVTEKLGANLSWDNKKRQVTLEYKNKTIKLVIDESVATVNGKEVNLPNSVPAKLMSYEDNWRTMVPVRFVSENFDLDIDWYEDIQTVAINSKEQDIKGIDFKYQKKFPELRIKTSGFVDINDYKIGSDEFGIADQYILSVPNTNLRSDLIEESSFTTKRDGKVFYDVSLFGINEMIMQKEQGDIKGTSISLDLEKRIGFNTFYDEESSEIVIQMINSVTDIDIEDIYNSNALIIETKEDMPDLNTYHSDGKVYIDIVNSKMEYNQGKMGKIDLDKEGIKSYEFKELDTNSSDKYKSEDRVTQIILTLSNDKSPEDVYVEEEDNKIFAYVAGNPLNGFEYVKKSQSEAKLDISFLESGDYNLVQQGNMVELTFDKKLLDIEDLELNIKDQIVEKINISKNLDKHAIRFEMPKGVSITENSSNENTDGVKLTFKNVDIMNSEYSDTLIVIDPGHGGYDPGAIGSKAKEKDIVLKAGLKLKDILEAKGFKVYMTREIDEYIDLYKRANVANKLNADLFVSLHANSFRNQSANGIEVLYSKDDLRDNYSFARLVQDYLISFLDRFDRGVKNRPRLVVLKNTEMPAILTEIGFLSNPKEQDLLLSDVYINKSMEAIYRGIVDQIDSLK
ncbi:MAG: N-acetylmuramoyl-L-alanine amidase [Bacillota bacterium]